jgi:polar amino acid transport system substrate-binding protein
MKNTTVWKRFGLYSVILAALGMFPACGPSQSAASSAPGSGDLLSRVMASGKVVAAFNLANAPWEDKDPGTGNFVGMSVDLMQGFAKGIGVQVEFMPLEFGSLIPAIQAGKADIICTNLSRTMARSTKVLYTEPIGGSPGVAIFMKGGKWTPATTLDQVNQPGVILTTEAGTIHETMAKQKFPNAKMNAVNQNSDGMAALKAGRAHFFLSGKDVGDAMKSKDPSVDYLNQVVFADSFAYGVKLSPDSYTFVQAFNNYLKIIKIDGTYGAIYQKYFHAPWVPNSIEIAN